MEDFKHFFSNKRNIKNLVILVVLAIFIPIGLVLIKQQALFVSKAREGYVKFKDGACVVNRNGTQVATCADVSFEGFSSLGPPLSGNPLPSPSPSVSPGISPSPSSSVSPVPSPSVKACDPKHFNSETWTIVREECQGRNHITVYKCQNKEKTKKKKESNCHIASGSAELQDSGVGQVSSDMKTPSLWGVIMQLVPFEINLNPAQKVYAQDSPDGEPPDSDPDDPNNPDTHDPPPSEPNRDDDKDSTSSGKQCKQGGERCNNKNNCCSNKCEKVNGNKKKTCVGDGPVCKKATETCQKNSDCCSKTCKKITGAKDKTCIGNGPSPSPSASTSASPSPGPDNGRTTFYKFAEVQADLPSKPLIPYDSEPIINNLSFANITPGPKFLFVEFRGINQGLPTIATISATINMVGANPQIDNIQCNKNSTGNGINFRLRGVGFGTSGTLTTAFQITPDSSASASIRVTGYSDNESSGVLDIQTDNIDEDTPFPVTITRTADGATAQATCNLGAAFEISLGARLFCRAPSQFATTNVEMGIYEQKSAAAGFTLAKKETVSIDKDGNVKGFEFKFTDGRKYVLSIKAPKALRRNTPEFTAEGGNNIINDFELPVGDIFPVQKGDGKIDAFDLSELYRQWGTFLATRPRSADFNLDSKINSVDFACMRYYLRDTDEPEP